LERPWKNQGPVSQSYAELNRYPRKLLVANAISDSTIGGSELEEAKEKLVYHILQPTTAVTKRIIQPIKAS
jgi:hypothetical protein